MSIDIVVCRRTSRLQHSDVEISHSVDATDIPFGYLSDLSSDGSDFNDVDARLAADDLAHLASQRMFNEP